MGKKAKRKARLVRDKVRLGMLLERDTEAARMRAKLGDPLAVARHLAQLLDPKGA